MHRKEGGKPDYLDYLQKIPELQDWPLHVLPDNDPTVCLFTFFRRGVVICKDSNTSEWIYIIKSVRQYVCFNLLMPIKIA